MMKNLLKAKIATGLAIGGVIFTAIVSSKDELRVWELAQDESLKKGRPLNKKEKLSVNVRGRVKTIVVAGATIASIYASHHYNKAHRLALAEAYLVLSQQYDRYRKTVESCQDEAAMKEIISHTPKPTYTQDDKQSFYFEHCGHIFESTMLEVVDAEYQANRKLIMNGHVTVNEFLDLLGQEKIKTGDVIGWDYNIAWIDFDHGIVDVDGMDCFVITPRSHPWADIDTRLYPLED